MLSEPSNISTTLLATKLDLLALSPSLSSHSESSSSVTTLSTQQAELRTLCEAAIISLPKEVAAFKSGSPNVLNKIVGHVMRASRGRADAHFTR